MKTRLSFLFGMALGLAACAQQPEDRPPVVVWDAGVPDAGLAAAPPASICGGGTELVLGMLALDPASRVYPGNRVIYENGGHFVYVDGSCRYWVRMPDTWSETRTGVLSDAQEAALTSRVRYAEWGQWAGEWTPSNGTYDAPLRLLLPGLDVARTVACHNNCFGDERLPPGLVAAIGSLADVAGEAWDGGAPLEGGVRFLVGALAPEEYAYSDHIPFLSWTVSGVVLAEVALQPAERASVRYGQGRYVEGEAAAAMRALRAQHVLTPTARNGLVPFIPVQDAEGKRYEFHMRDALPTENDAGLAWVP